MSKTIPTVPPVSELFLETHLYQTVNLSYLADPQRREYVHNIVNPTQVIDIYCLHCEQDSYFTLRKAPELMGGSQSQLQRIWQQQRNVIASIERKEEEVKIQVRQMTPPEQQEISKLNNKLNQLKRQEEGLPFDDLLFSVELSCARDEAHIMCCIFQLRDNKLQKIGQTPSIADIHEREVEKYRKLLKDEFKEFKRAIGLVSHGVGIGSFVYLRRIFENLVRKAHSSAKESDSWDEQKYLENKHMSEKIKLLKDFLPEFLVENAHLYGILSKGIHDLNEDECLEAFNAVRIGIELILDEKLQVLERGKKQAEAERALGDLKEKYS
jgi:hypothetical protein